MGRWRWILVTLSAFWLAACSSTTFVYNRFDFFIPWYVDKYVDLDREQEKHLDELLTPFLRWHRCEELPAYLEWLDELEPLLRQPISQQQLVAVGEQMQAAWERVELRGLEWMISLGESLGDDQIAELMAELRKKQKDYEEDDLARSDQEYLEDARKNLEEQLEDFLGRLNDSQEATLDKAVAQLWRADAIWLAERAGWLDRLEEILRREPGWQDELRQAVIERGIYNSEKYRAAYEHNSSVLYAALTDVLNGRTPRQDEHLRRELHSLREDIQVLMWPEHASPVDRLAIDDPAVEQSRHPPERSCP